MQPLIPLVFHNLPSLYPQEMIYTCFTDFWLCQCNSISSLLVLIPPFPCSRVFFVMQHAGIELGLHRYDATLLTSTLSLWGNTSGTTLRAARNVVTQYDVTNATAKTSFRYAEQASAV